MQTEVEKLFEHLDKRGITIQGLTLGVNPGTTEDIARELLKSLEALERGDFEILEEGVGDV